MAHSAKEEGDDDAKVSIVESAKTLFMASSSIYLAIALKSFLVPVSATDDSLLRYVGAIVILRGVVGRFTRRFAKNSPEKCWLFASCCGHLLGFQTKGLVFHLAEYFGVASDLPRAFLFVGLAFVVVPLWLIAEALCQNYLGNNRLTMRESLRTKNALQDVNLDAFAIALGAAMNGLFLMLLDLEGAFEEEEGQCGTQDSSDHEGQEPGLTFLIGSLSFLMLIVVPVTRALIIHATGRLDKEKNSTTIQFLEIVDKSFVLLAAWNYIPVVLVLLKSVFYTSGVYISFIAACCLGMIFMSRKRHSIRLKCWVGYFHLIWPVIVGVMFERMVQCIFNPESETATVKGSWEPKRLLFFAGSSVLFTVNLYFFGSAFAEEHEKELEEEIERKSHLEAPISGKEYVPLTETSGDNLDGNDPVASLL
jgi:hypothetical protein